MKWHNSCTTMYECITMIMDIAIFWRRKQKRGEAAKVTKRVAQSGSSSTSVMSRSSALHLTCNPLCCLSLSLNKRASLKLPVCHLPVHTIQLLLSSARSLPHHCTYKTMGGVRKWLPILVLAEIKLPLFIPSALVDKVYQIYLSSNDAGLLIINHT
jgi:hypothetical protein